MAAVCSVEGCGRPVKAHGLCQNCYVQRRRRGSTERTRLPKGTGYPVHMIQVRVPDEQWARIRAMAAHGEVGVLARRLLLAEIEKR